jgi:hypothetical protein
MFLVKPIDHVAGSISEMTDLLMDPGTASGNGDLAYVTFKAIGFGVATIHITDPKVLDEGSVETPADYVVDGIVTIPVPSPTAPVAISTITPAPPIYVGTLLTLDGSASTDGIDTWPVPPGAENEPITEWKWDIDVGNDGSIEHTIYGEIQTYTCEGPGSVGITLTVTAPDQTPPTQTYVDHSSTKKVINQLSVPMGPAIDLFDIVDCTPPYEVRSVSSLGPIGNYPDGWADVYGPQEEVCIAAKVTYNDEPVEYKPVGFEMIDANGIARDYRVAFTDADGIAIACFRIPWEGSNAEAEMGDWSVVGTVDVAGTTVTDTVKFRFNYILHTFSITVDPSTLKKLETLTIDVDIQSNSMNSRHVFLTMVAVDECKVPIDLAIDDFWVAPEDGMSLGNTITIPQWAFVGNAVLYVNLFTDAPSAGGLPYCPEHTAFFTILKT